MQCPKCQFDNLRGMNFCGKCGYKPSISSKTTIKELSFEEILVKIQKYLPRGFTKKILFQRDRIQGERKQVTVMLFDLEGFNPFTEKLGPDNGYIS